MNVGNLLTATMLKLSQYNRPILGNFSDVCVISDSKKGSPAPNSDTSEEEEMDLEKRRRRRRRMKYRSSKKERVAILRRRETNRFGNTPNAACNEKNKEKATQKKRGGRGRCKRRKGRVAPPSAWHKWS